MHSHLDIKVNGKSLVIPEDSSLSVEEKNPLFNDVTFFSYPMQIPVEGNREVLKNIAHRDSNMRAMDLEHADARIFADGLPLNHGQVITQDGSEIKDTFEFNIDAQQQSFDELIGDLECQDVKVKDRILIGEKIGNIDYEVSYTAKDYYYLWRDGSVVEEGVMAKKWPTSKASLVPHKMEKSVSNKSGTMDAIQALGFSFPGRCVGFPAATPKNASRSRKYGSIEFTEPVVAESFINVTKPYPFPYCNMRVSYAHPDVKKNDDGTYETDGVVQGNNHNPNIPEDYGQYWCLDANRQQSGICFYVLYFLDCLFEQLGVKFDKSELLDIDDLTRLCFVTTQCNYDSEVTSQKLNNINEINQWLSSRNCGGHIDFLFATGKAKSGNYSDEELKELQEEYVVDDNGNVAVNEEYSVFQRGGDGTIGTNTGGTMHCNRVLNGNVKCSAYIHNMYANSLNFPNASVSSVISSLENSFGIRFLFDSDKRVVKARLLRNIYREQKTVPLRCTVLSMTPVVEKIRGVHMAYSSESDIKEQRQNIIKGVRDYDTNFDYIDFPDPSDVNVGRRTVTNLSYRQILQQVAANNMNVYVDMATGNAYRVKVDEDATDTLTLRPILFQVGQNNGVKIGDCSENGSGEVKEFVSDFIPIPTNVINAKQYNDPTEDVSPILAPLLDVEMEHEYLEQKMRSVAYYDDLGRDDSLSGDDLRSSNAFPNGLQLVCRVRMWLSENYNPTQTGTGNSPLQDINWGLTVGVMRGAGSGTGYGYVANIEISKAEFLVIMDEHFGSVYPATGTTGLSALYNYVSSMNQDEVLDGKTGLTPRMVKDAITLAYDNGVESTIPGEEGYNVLFDVLTGTGISYILINDVKVYRYHFEEHVKTITDNAWHSQFNRTTLSKVKEYIESKISDGTYTRNTMLYSRCSLTVGTLLDDINAAIGYSGDGLWLSRYYYYLELVGRTGLGASNDENNAAYGSQVIDFDRDYDGFGNNKWRQTVGIYALTSDSMDMKGSTYDYNGNNDGIGGGERFSLQIRSWKQPEWSSIPLCIDDEHNPDGTISHRIRSRGLYDVFMCEHAYFLLKRKKYKVKCKTTIAQLLDIRNHWGDMYIIDGKIGFIDRLKYNITRADGVKEAEIDFYTI